VTVRPPTSDAGRLASSLAFARKAVALGKDHEHSHWFLMALGMAEFRNGHWPEKPHIWLTSAFYRAMNLFRQGKRDEAHKLTSEAQAKMKPVSEGSDETQDHDDLIVWMAYKEANQLLQSKATGSPRSSEK
jgi:hypothetical protein